jgi:hypothetical protein
MKSGYQKKIIHLVTYILAACILNTRNHRAMVSSQPPTTDRVKKKRKPVVRKHICKDSGCKRSFNYPCELQWHVDFAHAPYKFNNVCDHIIDKKNGTMCGFKCETPGNLKQHKKHSHSKVRTFKCNVCVETFKTKKIRDYHEVSRCSPLDDPRRTQYKCKACNEGFMSTHHRTSHYLHRCAPEDDPERIALLVRNRAYINARYATDENFRLGCLARDSSKRLLAATGLEKNSSSSKDLGCTRAEYLVHLNDNDRGLVYGQKGVVVDHIRPVDSFKNLPCRVAFWECTNFQNMQLLTQEENGHKSDSFTDEERDAYYTSAAGIKILALRDVWRAEGVCECEQCVCE